MNCPFCRDAETSVIDSRLSQDGASVRRRRQCDRCGKRFTTYERLEEAMPLVIKKDGRREVFDRTKILIGLQKACEKRPVPAEQIEHLLNRIEQSIRDEGEREISSAEIGRRVIAALHDLDKVAYVRFASVYREFKDIGEFMDELKGLL